ncbi:hypothetical protein THAOC_27566, partial [Thalassiosira oceanica]
MGLKGAVLALTETEKNAVLKQKKCSRPKMCLLPQTDTVDCRIHDAFLSRKPSSDFVVGIRQLETAYHSPERKSSRDAVTSSCPAGTRSTKRSFSRPSPRALTRLRLAFPAPLAGSSPGGGREDLASLARGALVLRTCPRASPRTRLPGRAAAVLPPHPPGSLHSADDASSGRWRRGRCRPFPADSRSACHRGHTSATLAESSEDAVAFVASAHRTCHLDGRVEADELSSPRTPMMIPAKAKRPRPRHPIVDPSPKTKTPTRSNNAKHAFKVASVPATRSQIDVSTPTAEMLVSKILFNSVVSTKGAKFMTMDIKNFYLMTPLNRPEYLKLKLSQIPDEIIEEYQLRVKATPDGSVYVEINKGMYGLPQAGVLANKLLEKRLNQHGYYQSK